MLEEVRYFKGLLEHNIKQSRFHFAILTYSRFDDCSVVDKASPVFNTLYNTFLERAGTQVLAIQYFFSEDRSNNIVRIDQVAF